MHNENSRLRNVGGEGFGLSNLQTFQIPI